MEYPEELYEGSVPLPMQGMASAVAERSYRLGYEAAKADPLAGYSNLTEAIKAGEPIDWEKLDGLKVQCVNPELRGELHGALGRNEVFPANGAGGWGHQGMDSVYTNALFNAWHSCDGWTLWVEGEVPLRRKTADQLPVTTFFKGRRVGISGAGSFMCVGESENGKFILSAIDFLPSSRPAEEWEVLEDYGTFQKPEGK